MSVCAQDQRSLIRPVEPECQYQSTSAFSSASSYLPTSPSAFCEFIPRGASTNVGTSAVLVEAENHLAWWKPGKKEHHQHHTLCAIRVRSVCQCGRGQSGRRLARERIGDLELCHRKFLGVATSAGFSIPTRSFCASVVVCWRTGISRSVGSKWGRCPEVTAW